MENHIGLIESWHDELRERFDKLWKPWVKLHYARGDEYDKHFPEKGWDRDKILHMSTVPKNGELVSYFYPGFTRERLMRHFWTFLDDHWEEIAARHHHRLYEDAVEIVGADHGADTHIVRWDIHVSNKLVHAYPVLASAIPEGDFPYENLGKFADEPEEWTIGNLLPKT